MSPTKWFIAFLFLFTVQHIKIADGIPVTAILLLGLAGWALHRRLVRLRRRLAGIYLAIVGTSVASFIINGGQSSFASMAYLLLLTTPFVLSIRPAAARALTTPGDFHEGFRRFMIVAILLGAVQMVMGGDFFSVRSLLPEDLLLEGFNTSNQMEVGSFYIYRSNGFFFLEPSFFSQYLAFAILFEMRTRRHLPTIALMLVGMAMSLSGSGFMLLTIGLFVMGLRARSSIAILYSLAPVLVAGIAIVYFLPSLADRVTELNDEDKSGYWRFVMPILYVYESYSSSVVSMLFGVGPGAAKNDVLTALMAYSSGIGKVLYENGLLGGVPIIMIYHRFIMESFGERWFSISMLFFILVVNCGVQEPMTLMVVLLFAWFGAPALSPRRMPSRRASSSLRPGVA